MSPQAPAPYLLLGQIRTQQGQGAAAREVFGKAAEVYPAYAPAHLVKDFDPKLPQAESIDDLIRRMGG